MNTGHAEDSAACTKADTVAPHRKNAAAAGANLRGRVDSIRAGGG